uniref:Uncharacterized protein n=1 Tax=Arundo donax TaxID=35708 RepID=A0A0A9A1Q1_ARUDO
MNLLACKTSYFVISKVCFKWRLYTSFSRASVNLNFCGDLPLAQGADLQSLPAVGACLVPTSKNKVLCLTPADWTSLLITYITVLSRS